MIRKMLLLLLFFSGPLFAQTNTFPFTVSGTEAAKPSSCVSPSFYSSTDTGNLYSCLNGAFALIGSPSSSGGVASAALAPRIINFGTVHNGNTANATVAIANTSAGSSIVISGVSFSGNSDFSSSNPSFCNITLPSGAVCVLPVQFIPTAAAPESSVLTVTTSAPVDPSNPLTVLLSGTGTASTTFLLSVANAGTGSGRISSGEAVPLINCTFSPIAPPSGSCSNNYTSGSVVTLTATPLSGSTFTSFSGGGCSTSPCNVTVSAGTTVTGTFAAPVTNLTLSITGQGQGTGTITSDVAASGGILNCTSTAGIVSSAGNSGCSGAFASGTVITLTEAPNGSSTFVSWTGASGCTTASTCQVALNAAQTVTANFTPTAVPLALIQTASNCSTATSSTIKCTMASAQLAGDLVVCAGAWPNATTTVSSMADISGNTWTQIPTISPQTATGLTQVAYYAANIAAATAGTNIITMTLSTNVAARDMRCMEEAGIVSANPVDVSNFVKANSGAITADSITPSQNNDWITGFATTLDAITATSAGYVQEIKNNSLDEAADIQGGTTSATAYTPTKSGSGSWITFNVGWKAQSTTSTSNKFSLTIVGGGNGNGTVTIPGSTCTFTAGVTLGCSVQVAANSTPTITASASLGSNFAGWGGVTGCSSSATCIVPNITGNTSITVVFNLSGALNYYVNGSTGNDANDGLAASAGGGHAPWATLQKAINAFALGAAGTQINVAAATYAGLDITRGGSASARLTLICTPGAASATAAINQCKEPSNVSFANIGIFVEPGVSFVTIQGFDIGNNVNMSAGIGIASQTPAASSIYAVGNYVHDLGSNVFNSAGTVGPGCPEAGAITGGNTPASTDLRAIGNFVKNYGVNPALPNCSVSQGIYFAGTNEVYENNLIFKVPTGGIQIQTATNTIVSNNVIVSTKECIIIEAVSGTPGHNTFANNYCGAYSNFAMFFASGTTKCSGSAPNLFSHNVVDGSALDFNVGPFSCDTCSPSPFVRQAGSSFFTTYAVDGSGTYTLKGGSVGIDGGSVGCVTGGLFPCTPATDFLGVARPVGAAIDVGAYEQ